MLLKKRELKRKGHQHKIPPEGMTACRRDRLGSLRYESEGQAHKRAILLSRGSTKEGCRSWTLKDGKNLDMQREWGRGGHFGRGWGVAEGKVRRASRKPRRMPAGEWWFKGVEGSREARRAPGNEDISVHRVGTR